ncbi:MULTISPECIES: class I SAM-dependent methyltransferase [Brevibacillus]|uniref:class I SAM-dependent methyltransferase n=1 Tax=Brevibacillus TaxID=55080 RepID=UPI000D0EF4F5|nr:MULTISPECIES: SAM-dependent methyltransferase [Brevibacillus]MED1947345.1 SAM-dependent methyltransferase [Brevibacillus formosus]MED1997388.1 SAM-dependent methyltransferase [Brevibacillus formosus]MED2083245.1 SAM-dependent methyltransferase [Brevibacillus formosus]PSK16933.1 SAM-dependent methyltransferase [Brevibacillus sp. NRRL NRS-603]
MTMIELIREEIESQPGKAITFARFMELALYHDTYGYYMVEQPKVGKAGDFYTSASVHPVFAETIADAVMALWEEADITSPVLVEIGGGTGAVCRHMLERIRECNPEVYKELPVILIEASPYHRKMQQEALQWHEGPKRWYSSVNEAAKHEKIEGVIFSNEWLDAFTVHIVEKTKSGWQEVWVRVGEDGLEECLGEMTPALGEYVRGLNLKLPIGMRIEINLAMEQAAQEVSCLLKKGFVITIDYGDMQEELYHPSRKNGTLMCYHRHQAHTNPYIHIGEQDLTTHVNFSAWKQYGEKAGLRERDYMRQDRFLMRNGLLHKAVAHMDTDPFTSVAMKRNRAIQQLIDPAGLGGRFWVMIQEKGIRE